MSWVGKICCPTTCTHKTFTESLVCAETVLSALPESTSVIPTIVPISPLRSQSREVARPVFEPKHSGSVSVFLTPS